MKALSSVPGPGDASFDMSKEMKQDNYYELPKYVETFIDRCNQELSEPYHVKPWTINRAVTLFKGQKGILSISYGDIELHLALMVESVCKLANKENIE